MAFFTAARELWSCALRNRPRSSGRLRRERDPVCVRAGTSSSVPLHLLLDQDMSRWIIAPHMTRPVRRQVPIIQGMSLRSCGVTVSVHPAAAVLMNNDPHENKVPGGTAVLHSL